MNRYSRRHINIYVHIHVYLKFCLGWLRLLYVSYIRPLQCFDLSKFSSTLQSLQNEKANVNLNHELIYICIRICNQIFKTKYVWIMFALLNDLTLVWSIWINWYQNVRGIFKGFSINLFDIATIFSICFWKLLTRFDWRT